jgi:hypothetical protein
LISGQNARSACRRVGRGDNLETTSTGTSGRKDDDGDRRRMQRPRSASCRWSEREHAEQRADKKEDRAAALGNGEGVGLGLQDAASGGFKGTFDAWEPSHRAGGLRGSARMHAVQEEE